MRAGRLVLATFVALGFAGPAGALDAGDGAAFRDAIDRQITAFRADDAEGAWAFAAPGIRTVFGAPERFLDMVRRVYPPVYRPGRYSFGDTTDLPGGGGEQAVRIDDADGVGWLAIYTFERQPDGHWAISGCRLVRAPDQSVRRTVDAPPPPA